MDGTDPWGGRSWRWLLPAVEVAWYATVLTGVLTGRLAGYGRDGRVEFFLLLALAVVCAALALTRWWRPGWTAAVAAGVLGVGIVVLLARPIGPLGPLRQMLSLAVGPILLAATVRRSRPAAAAVVVVLAVLAGAIDTRFGGFTLSADLARVLTGDPTPGRVQILPVAAFVALVPVAVGLAMRSADASRRAAELARLRIEERVGTARELHDLVAGHVTGIILTAQAAGLRRDVEEPTSQALWSIEAAGDRALDAMRRMVTALRSTDPDGPAPQPVVARTPLAAARAAIDGDPAVRLSGPAVGAGVADGPDGAAPEVLTTVHRLIVEGLTNARRHAPDGSVVDVELAVPRPGSLLVQVTNDRRKGPSRARGGGFGLVGLAERVDAVGGSLRAGPLDGRRWRLCAELPHRPEQPR